MKTRPGPDETTDSTVDLVVNAILPRIENWKENVCRRQCWVIEYSIKNKSIDLFNKFIQIQIEDIQIVASYMYRYNSSNQACQCVDNTSDNGVSVI